MAVEVRLLGSPAFRRGVEWLHAPLDKRMALLTYLACADGWTSRERLAYLFWPDTTTPNARINLRRLLARTRLLPLPVPIDADGEMLGWRVESDVARFRQAMSEADWATALSTYQGDLVADMVVQDGGEFGIWLETERSRLREAHRQAVLGAATMAATAERPDEDAVVRLLSSDYCRLLTLHGPAGAGKTHLARRVAHQVTPVYSHGCAFVPLAQVEKAELLPAELAAGLGLELDQRRPPLDQLIDFLEPRKLLLILDGFGHLADGPLLVHRLLSDCPDLKVLVTSRRRLLLQGEWLFPLPGRATPRSGPDGAE